MDNSLIWKKSIKIGIIFIIIFTIVFQIIPFSFCKGGDRLDCLFGIAIGNLPGLIFNNLLGGILPGYLIIAISIVIWYLIFTLAVFQFLKIKNKLHEK
jgi:hypothetical protein